MGPAGARRRRGLRSLYIVAIDTYMVNYMVNAYVHQTPEIPNMSTSSGQRCLSAHAGSDALAYSKSSSAA